MAAANYAIAKCFFMMICAMDWHRMTVILLAAFEDIPGVGR